MLLCVRLSSSLSAVFVWWCRLVLADCGVVLLFVDALLLLLLLLFMADYDR